MPFTSMSSTLTPAAIYLLNPVTLPNTSASDAGVPKGGPIVPTETLMF